MAKSPTSKRDEKHELTRRALIKWTVATGAALGVSRSRVYEILEKTAGKGVAYAASNQPINRTFDIEFGNGSLAWMMLFWPLPAVAQANNAAFSYHKPGMATAIAGTDKPLYVGPDTPWTDLPAQRQITAFVCGNNETHTNFAQSTTQIGGANLLAASSALQSALSATIPTITVGQGTSIGTAPGSTTTANVATADGMVDLFNSAASQMGGLLVNSDDATLYRAHYQAFIQLNRAATRPTTRTAYTTATSAAQFLGTNRRDQLAVKDADLTRYGITAGTRASVAALGRTMIIAVKAFKLGLTNSIVVPAMRDDPHGAFDAGDVNTVPPQLKSVFNGFMADLRTTLDDNTQKPLADNIVITMKGDTYKNPFNKNGWGDNTPQNSNIVFVYSAGQLYSGWQGDVTANAVQGVGADGKLTAYNGANTAKIAMSSVLYAVAQGDDRAIQNFVGGTTVSGIFGRPKQT